MSARENRIIYIIGAGRSGTTLLDIILGNATNIFSGGELNRFTKRNGIPHDARDAEVSSFWNKVANQLIVEGYNSPEYYYKLSSKFEYHNSLFRLILLQKKKDFKLYSSYQQSLFKAIETNAVTKYSKKMIVDSSKYPLRAYFLSKIFGSNISFIYINRNPQAVVESFQKKEVEQPSKSRFIANVYLLFVNLLSRRIIGILKNKHKVSITSYEDIIKSPVYAMNKIEKELEIDLSEPKKRFRDNLPFNVGLLFDGNRLRLEKEIYFKTGGSAGKPKQIIDKLFYPLHKLGWYNN